MLFEHLGAGILGEPQILDLGPNENAYYPAFSPDSNWIASNHSTEDACVDANAELWAISSSGGSQIRLDSANKSVNLLSAKMGKIIAIRHKVLADIFIPWNFVNMTSGTLKFGLVRLTVPWQQMA